jgi:hypothetical protein
MPTTTTQNAQLAIFQTKPIGSDGNFVLAWQQFFQSIISFMASSPKAYTLTHSQRLALATGNLTIGSIVYETDSGHVDLWNGKTWVQLI